MRDLSPLIDAVTNESVIAAAAVQALIATEQHLQDAQAQIAVLQQQQAANALDPDQVTKLLDTVSTTTAQLSAAIPANAAPAVGAAVQAAPVPTGAPTPVVPPAPAAVPAAVGGDPVQARDAVSTADPAVPPAGATGAPGAYAQPTDAAAAGVAAGPGPVDGTTAG